MMQKNEGELLPIWVEYYSNLFLPKSLYIFDNGSNDKLTLDALHIAERKGVNVIYDFNNAKDFESKGIIIGNKIQEIDQDYDFIIPLDCDEFIGCRTQNGGISFQIEDIVNELTKHLDTKETLLFDSQGFNSPVSKEHFFFRNDRKCFFRQGTFLSLDVGFHWGKTKFCDGEHRTNLIQLHFHNKPYDVAKEHAREKLKLRVNSFLPEDIKNYTGPGVHMVKYFTMNHEEYLDSFIFKPYYKVPEFLETLEMLGISWPYEQGLNDALNYFKNKIEKLSKASLKCGLLPPDVHRECKGHLDKVDYTSECTFIYGWASNSANVRPKYFFIYDGVDFHRVDTYLPIERPDVSKHLGVRNKSLGFRLTIPNRIVIDPTSFEVYCSSVSDCVGSKLGKVRISHQT